MKAISGGDLGEAADEVGADVDPDDLMAEAPQRLLHPPAGLERDLPLERATALQDRNETHAVVFWIAHPEAGWEVRPTGPELGWRGES
jgi:hypothetical protein